MIDPTASAARSGAYESRPARPERRWLWGGVLVSNRPASAEANKRIADLPYDFGFVVWRGPEDNEALWGAVRGMLGRSTCG